MKRLVCLLFLVLVLGNLFFLSAETLPQADDVVASVSDIRENVDSSIKDVNSQAYWEQKWDYLGQEYPKLLLTNPYFAAVDSVFQKFSLVFRILFGVPYSVSLTLLFIVAVWVFFSIMFTRIIRATGILTGYSFIPGVLVSVILAQTGAFKALVIFLGNLVFAPKYSWMRFIVFALIVLAFIGVGYLDSWLSKSIKGKKGDAARKELENYQKAQLEREKAREETSKLVK